MKSSTAMRQDCSRFALTAGERVISNLETRPLPRGGTDLLVRRQLFND